MPRSIDHEERRRDIARAAIRLISRAGPRGLTLRALAEELGGSITLVTHFLPNRRALLDVVTQQLIEDSASELAEADMPGLPPAERLRRFLTWLLPTTADALALERSRVLMSAESEAHFDVQNFFDTWESAIRALIEQYIAPLVSPPELQFYVDLLRVIQNGVVLSAVEHRGYWTEEKRLAFIDSLVPMIGQTSAISGQ